MSAGDFRLGVLTSGENVLWQGQPVPSFIPSVFGFFILFIGGFFAVGTLLFMAMLRSELAKQEITGTPETVFSIWLFLSSLLAISLGIMASAVLWPRCKQKNTWYTLTTKQIFIATSIPFIGKYRQSFMIQDCKAPELQDGRLQSVFSLKKQCKAPSTITVLIAIPSFQLALSVSKTVTKYIDCCVNYRLRQQNGKTSHDRPR
ncbi:hypothetical protein DL239_16890 [Sedimentitalea sp. CY04]|uniref:Uncharacterized protein n=1 Tax=Parasedimentitalea denitrificans TaxID=2211118 RepID=A0ABX0WAG2_9RHOB|nr:hypothetical protein [Sedimentitalea sp. CY04]NIZ62650.1 hypothetical protein [Sedimentitalea sp. CY04]